MEIETQVLLMCSFLMESMKGSEVQEDRWIDR